MNEESKVALEAAHASKLYKIRDKEKAKSYPEISAAQKHDIIANTVAQHREAFQRNSKRDRVDLRDAKAVEIEIESYLTDCERYGQLPTLMGLACYMGYSRINLYFYLSHHGETESAQLLDNFRSLCASILSQASLSRTTDNATSIFLLKNSGQALSDRSEVAVELSRGEDPMPKQRAEEITRRWAEAEAAGIELPD